MWLSPLQNLLYACFCCFLVLVLVLLFLRICICFCIVKAVVFLSFMALMATVAVRVIPINPRSNVGVLYLGPRRYGFGMELRCSGALESSRKWEYLAVLAQKAITLVDDDKPFTPGVESSGPIHHLFDKDLDLLPKPLSATDLSASPANDREVRIAYQGKPGGYSEAAALKAYPKCEAVPCDQFEVAFKTVELWLADKAVIPIENTVAGSMHRNYDLLLRHRLHIVGEVKLAVNHCLLGLPGVKKDELKHVLSHPQVLAQCEMLLSNLGIAQVSADDTAGAAQTVASSGIRDIGAIASARAAEIYGLDILAERIQDEDSVTRFLILAREPILPGTDRPYKTSIVFSLEKGPSVLFKALVLFALRGIRMSNIESRPLKKRPFRVVDDSNKATAECFDYLFYIDFEASIADPRVQYALEHLEEHTSFLRVLGCYPMDKSL